MGPTQAPDTPVLSSGSRPGVDAEDPEGPSYPRLSVLVLRHALAQCPEGREGQPLQRPPPWPPASFPVQHMWGMEGHSGAVARAPGLPRLTCVAVGTVRRGGGARQAHSREPLVGGSRCRSGCDSVCSPGPFRSQESGGRVLGVGDRKGWSERDCWPHTKPGACPTASGHLTPRCGLWRGVLGDVAELRGGACP